MTLKVVYLALLWLRIDPNFLLILRLAAFVPSLVHVEGSCIYCGYKGLTIDQQ